MKSSRSWLFGLAFVALLFVCSEAHEIAHTGLGRWFCGSWGPRDANVWRLSCELAPLPLFAVQWAGPLLTYSLTWVGYWLLGSRQSAARSSLGLALVFANLPLARLLGIAMGGNDEVNSLKRLMPYPLAWGLGVLLAGCLLAPPLARAYRRLGSPGWFAAALVLPVLLSYLITHKAFNVLLLHGVLAGPGWLGEPRLVTAWLLLTSGTLLFTARLLLALPARPVAAVLS